jgi:hypothetical protein
MFCQLLGHWQLILVLDDLYRAYPRPLQSPRSRILLCFLNAIFKRPKHAPKKYYRKLNRIFRFVHSYILSLFLYFGLLGLRVDVHRRCGPETGRPLFADALCDKDRFQVGFRGDLLLLLCGRQK